MAEIGYDLLGAGFEDRVHPPAKVAVTLDLLTAAGIPAQEVLRGTGIAVDDLASPSTRISLSQLMSCYGNAMRLSHDPLLAFRIGSKIHISAYGMYGYAMLCSTNTRRTMEFAARYHLLATPATSISFAERDGTALWTIEPVPHPRLDPPLYAFVAELQMGIHLSLHRDIIGEQFTPATSALPAPRRRDPQRSRQRWGAWCATASRRIPWPMMQAGWTCRRRWATGRPMPP
ncbi:AraC family transcriptional regulator ligand-binding domain-containing protein [Oleomonas cavernae]|uniref:AraC family transcriptional regulator ligand-binding domain-containing protein n=1 Tax=Oleomonas cavernae TaxID=2320859 RepID=UPI001F39F6C8|nr:AraC family transcriptional regulator ligand-binding domain-containing protein [Oleomonas cavernae]